MQGNIDKMGINSQAPNVHSDADSLASINSGDIGSHNEDMIDKNSIQFQMYLRLIDLSLGQTVEMRLLRYGATEFLVDNKKIGRIWISHEGQVPVIHFYAQQFGNQIWSQVVEEFFFSQADLKDRIKIIAPSLYTAFQLSEQTSASSRKFYIDDILARLGLELPDGLNERLYYRSNFIQVNHNPDYVKVEQIVRLIEEFYRDRVPGFRVLFCDDRDMYTTLRVLPISPFTYRDIIDRSESFVNALRIIDDLYLEMISFVKSRMQ